jgi:serine/threonine protein kinase
MTGNIGTLVYMSPEILLNQPYNDRCDVYSFGIIMHEMYFETRPYTSDEFGNLFVSL